MKELAGLTVLVLGLGDSGLAMARWCARCGAHVRVWDSREQPPQARALREAVPQAELLTGPLPASAVEGVARVLKSPGLAPHDERIAPALEEARRRGVPVQGELDLFAQALAALEQERRYAPAVLAVTGTNGKTTTASLTALLVERAGKRVALAGNIGPTMLDTLARALDEEPLDETVAADAVPAGDEAAAHTQQPPVEPIEQPGVEPADDPDAPSPAAADAQEGVPLELSPPAAPAPVFRALPEVWVLELSSFQLDGVQGFEPSAAVVLNLSQDHLDWHGSMEAYAAAKARIYGRESVMVVNREDPLVEAMVPPPVPGKGRFARPVERRVVRFGLDAPTRPGDFGLIVENGMAWLVRAMEADETLRLGRTRKRDDEEEVLHIQRLMPADALRIRGRHNAANALAGMVAHPASVSAVTRPAIGLTMFGVTTPCVQAVTRRLEDDWDCLVFHATGVGGQSMEKLADSGLLAGAIDVSTTEVADEIAGGVLSAGPDRLDVFARHALPYVGSCGALDMVNFGAWDTVPCLLYTSDAADD